MDIYNRFKEIRISQGLTQVEFGKKLGISRDQIANIENKRVEMTDIKINRCVKAFGINPEWLRTGKGEMYLDYDDLKMDEDVLYFAKFLKEKDESTVRLIHSIIKTYEEMDEKEQKQLNDFVDKILENMDK